MVKFRSMTNRNTRSGRFLIIAFAVLVMVQPGFSQIEIEDQDARRILEDLGQQDVGHLRDRAERGNPEVQYLLGLMYANGWGVPQDNREAVKWSRKAAEQGEARAQFHLGWMYDKGVGVLENYQEAVKWYRRAAEQGDDQAQNNLGVMCLQVEKIECDYVKAYAWLVLAAAQGNKKAAKNKDLFKQIMDSAQVVKAQNLAAELLKRIESSKSR